MQNHVVSHDERTEARTALLEKEKQLNRLRDELAAERRNLPWTKVTEKYVFEDEQGHTTLGELFQGKSQLIVYHFMYGKGWQEGCKSCSFWADQYDTINQHIGERDLALCVISRAPWQDFSDFKNRMEWQFNWLSSADNSFNEDYHGSFNSPGEAYYNYHTTGVGEEMPGLSVFYKDDEGEIFHTYSCYSRGLDPLNATYQMLDLVPKGRDEQDLPFAMAWVQFHNSYPS